MASDPRALNNAEIAAQRSRFEQQQGPLVNMMAYNYGRGSEADFGNYNDIMAGYRNIWSGAGTPSEGGGGGGGGGGGSTYDPFLITNNDPYKSYEGYTEFSKTGGYSPTDIANMRARGVSPIRAAYANAEREVGRQRSLQGGYSPNAVAVQARMAREMGQSNADAVQNVEAGLAEARNKGRLSGLSGMSGIEADRYNKDIDIQKYNAAERARAQSMTNASAQAAADRSAAGAAASRADQLRALEGGSRLYGTTPGQSALFGNQVGQMVLGGGNMGLGYINSTNNANAAPGQFEQTASRINTGINTAQNIAGAAGTIWNAYNSGRKQNPTGVGPSNVPQTWGNQKRVEEL